MQIFFQSWWPFIYLILFLLFRKVLCNYKHTPIHTQCRHTVCFLDSITSHLSIPVPKLHLIALKTTFYKTTVVI